MNIPSTCDVVVIGGGPAGSLASTYLAQKGYQVVLLEKSKHPRYQVGESLLPDFWKYCDAAGATEEIESEGFLSKGGGTISWAGHTRVHSFKDFGYTRTALHVERDRFDHILIENARKKGVMVFEEVFVSDVTFDISGRQIVKYRLGTPTESNTISCHYVIDASGQSAILAKKLNLLKIDEAFRHMSVWGYFDNSDYVAFGGDVHPPEDLRDFLPTTYVTSLDKSGESGWSWHIPLRKRTSVGLVLPRHLMKSVRNEGEDWEAYFIRQCQATPVLERLLENATFIDGSLRIIRDYSYVTSEVAGPGFFLVGDAAGFHDPVFSVGIVLGMYAAYAAAWAIDRCIKNPGSDLENQGIYAKMLRGRIELARSLALPSYRTAGKVSEMAKAAIALERNEVQDLMYVVSELTARSDNYKDITGESAGRDVGPEKLRKIETITFSKSLEQ